MIVLAVFSVAFTPSRAKPNLLVDGWICAAAFPSSSILFYLLHPSSQSISLPGSCEPHPAQIPPPPASHPPSPR
ncbi:hypothetical protein C8J57DRAFT_1375942 [Mycena rebaudengoi]|nr:hypothetical protein C8J57DRAFT_1384485 [Mycena rebaudengoi]KAJ7237122.1 hypothetical protein C8J57DRAFT_1375942 [Mycena rebaudengoi]